MIYSSVIPAKAGTHTMLHLGAVGSLLIKLQLLMDPGLRRDDDGVMA